MNTQQHMEERLWEFIDGHCTPEEKSRVETQIARQAEWREKYQELLEIHASLQLTELEEPSLRFTKNVMEEIGKLHIAPATKSYINKHIIRGIGIFFITLLISILIYGISQTDFSSGETSSFGSKLDKIDLRVFFSNDLLNVFMMINVLLGLVILDYYFNSKRKKFSKDNQ